MSNEIDNRAVAVAAWWHARTGRHAPYTACRKLGALAIPVDRLIAHLGAVAAERDAAGDRLASLRYFTSGVGMTRLRELEQAARQPAAKKQRKGGITNLHDLLAGYCEGSPLPEAIA